MTVRICEYVCVCMFQTKDCVYINGNCNNDEVELQLVVKFLSKVKYLCNWQNYRKYTSSLEAVRSVDPVRYYSIVHRTHRTPHGRWLRWTLPHACPLVT